MDFIKGNEQVKIDPNGIDISGTSNIVVKSEGKIGIGTNNPQHPLQVNGSHAIFSNNPELLLFKESDPGRIGPTLDWGTENYTDWKIKAEDSGLKIMSGINSNTYEKLSLLNDGTIDISGDVSLHGDLSLNGDISMNGTINISGDIEISGNNKFVVTDTGNVGIGTNSSEVKLHIHEDQTDTYIQKWSYGDEERALELMTPNTVTDPFIFNTGNAIEFKIDNTSAFKIHDDRAIGIGTNNPNKAKLHIEGYKWHTISARYYNKSGGQAWGSVNRDLSIWTSNHIACSELQVYSDKRIKTDISLINDDTALNRVNALESYEYNYIDPIRRRPMKTIGFIAQEVKEVVPNAVSLQPDFVPDEMRIITEPTWSQDASNNWLLEIPELDMSGAFTGKAKFYVSNYQDGSDEVCKEVEIKEVFEQGVLISNVKHFAIFDEKWNNVFFYGKEVSDFHSIEKSQIFALHHSAIQELDRKHKREVTEKNSKINNLEQLVENLTVRLESLESLVLSLQNN